MMRLQEPPGDNQIDCRKTKHLEAIEKQWLKASWQLNPPTLGIQINSWYVVAWWKQEDGDASQPPTAAISAGEVGWFPVEAICQWPWQTDCGNKESRSRITISFRLAGLCSLANIWRTNKG